MGRKNFKLVKENTALIAKGVREFESTKRQILQSSFSLLESYFNGIAWEFITKGNYINLSNRKLKLLKDYSHVSLKVKLEKYPIIVFDKPIDPQNYNFILDEAKLFRDSLIHPSPFSTPEKYGDFNKLHKLYNLDIETINRTLLSIINVILSIQSMKEGKAELPLWSRLISSSIERLKATDK